MATKQIQKSIDIGAPKEKVWEVLFGEKSNEWLEVFSEGTHVETDWQEGSTVVFVDNSQTGLVGKIVANKPHQELTIEYTGEVIDGKEEYETEDAKSMLGAQEHYILTENNGITHLAISAAMDENFFDLMSASWDTALEKIKQSSEK